MAVCGYADALPNAYSCSRLSVYNQQPRDSSLCRGQQGWPLCTSSQQCSSEPRPSCTPRYSSHESIFRSHARVLSHLGSVRQVFRRTLSPISTRAFPVVMLDSLCVPSSYGGDLDILFSAVCCPPRPSPSCQNHVQRHDVADSLISEPRC